jgi:hypothetical protein
VAFHFWLVFRGKRIFSLTAEGRTNGIPLYGMPFVGGPWTEEYYQHGIICRSKENSVTTSDLNPPGRPFFLPALD